jgi:5'-3' exonuclease
VETNIISSIGDTMEKHLYIDFSHLAYRCLFANAGAIKTNGWGIMRHLLIRNFTFLSERFEPNQIFICFDSPTIWRKSYYPEYKATRKAARDKQKDIVDWKEFFNFITEFKAEIREIFPFYCLEQEGLEADDIIAYLVRENPDKNKTIVTSDGDYVQLLRFKNTSIYDPLKDKMVSGVNPVLELEKKILTGDKSDNVPPIRPRLGEKTAEKMIESGQIDILLQ